MTFKDFLNELKIHTPYDFSDYSDSSIDRRLKKILVDHDLSMDQLVEKMKADEFFVERLIDEITVNTTELFRNPEIWVDFYEKAYPILKSKKTFNIWHAGCSSGQEVYSNLIILNELGLLDQARVYGTDINTKMVKASRQGVYRYKFNRPYIEAFNKVIAKKPICGITHIDIDKYFIVDENDDSLIVKDFLREKVNIKNHDLVLQEAPFFIKFDLIFCRNVLIYFNTALQLKVFQVFYDKLYNGGMLLLGHHESLTGFFKTKFTRNGPLFMKSSSFHLKF